MSLIDLALHNSLMQNACIAALLASLIGGIMGTFVVVKRMSFFSGSISHAILGGIGIALWLDRSAHFSCATPLVGATMAALLCAYLYAFMQKTGSNRGDAILTTLWTAGMSLGIIFISLTPGYVTDLSSYLIGDILWVSKGDLVYLTLLLIGTALFVGMNFQALKLMSFDPIEARIQGISIFALERRLLILISLSIVALIQIVGVVLVMSMVTLPQMVALLFYRSLSSVLIASCAISCFITFTGMQMALSLNLPIGATVALMSAILFSLGHLISHCKSK